jgi:actin-related protein
MSAPTTYTPSRLLFISPLHSTGLWNDQGGIRWSGPPKVFFPLIVRPRSFSRSLATPVPTVLDASVGRPKHVRVMAGALEGDVFIGRKAQEFRGLLKIKYPMEHGIVTDWDDMERIWNWVYAEELGTLSEEVRLSAFRGSHRPA